MNSDKTKDIAWSDVFDDIRSLVKHNQEDAVDLIEEEKEKINAWTKERMDELKNVKEQGDEQITALHQKLDELRVQAELGKADTRDQLERQRETLNTRLIAVRDYYNQMNRKSDVFSKRMSNQLDHLAMRIQILGLKMSYRKEQIEDQWDRKSEAVMSRVEELESEMKSYAHDTREEIIEKSSKLANAWDAFKSELKSS